MTKVIAVFLVILAIYGVWEGWVMWDKYNHDQDLKAQEEKSSEVVPQQLPGMSDKLETSLQKAQSLGANGLRNWLKLYGAQIQDPRRAWIEMDYMILIAHEDPAEAKRIFADVKDRTPETSPIYPRIKKLQKTYE